MADRRDAVAAAAELVLLVERLAREAGRGMVGTVGFIETRPNMINIVPGEADLLVDFRGIDPARSPRRWRASRRGRRRSPRGAAWPSNGPPSCGTRRSRSRRRWSRRPRPRPAPSGRPGSRLTSGASHDANHVARLCPIGLLFIPCRDGRSHCPEEWAEVEHLATGARVLLELLLGLDRDLA